MRNTSFLEQGNYLMCHHLLRKHFVNAPHTCLLPKSSMINSTEGPRLVSDVKHFRLKDMQVY